MPYARINMVEFKSREEMHKVITNVSKLHLVSARLKFVTAKACFGQETG